jgi:hypothetical protein
MVFGVRKNILRKIQKFETNKITINGLKQMLYETYQPFFIWGRTEGKTKPSRTFSRAQMYAIEGPGGRAMSGAQYWIPGRYVRDGYIILFDIEASPAGFRTFPIHRIEKIEKDGVIYEVV